MPRASIRKLARIAKEQDLPVPDSLVGSAESSLPRNLESTRLVIVRVGEANSGGGSARSARRFFGLRSAR
jgi:hypothetical protein